MTPLEFLSFRERLEAASGFQSDQFRQLEFVLGAKSQRGDSRFPDGAARRAALERRYRRADPLGCVPALPVARGIRVPAALLDTGRDRADRTLGGAAGGCSSTSTARSEERRAVRAAGRSRRGHPGVALPPREDGRAHDRRRSAGPAAPAVPNISGIRSEATSFQTSGRSGVGCDAGFILSGDVSAWRVTVAS